MARVGWRIITQPTSLNSQILMPTLQQGTRWCFTHNNWDAPDYQRYTDFFESFCHYGIAGREVGESGTRHLQGFFILKQNRTFHWLREHLPQCHLERARGTSAQASSYCKKDGDFDEVGEIPSSSGKRSDLTEFIQWGDQFIAEHRRAPTEREIAQAHPTHFIKHPRLALALQLRAPPPVLRRGELREWQRELQLELEETPDDRSIKFIVDAEGGKGKTWFQQFMLSERSDSQLLTIGKRDDLAHAVDESKSLFLFNVPRDQVEFLRYEILEQLKDRMVFSPKYQSRLKILHSTPHVVVFMNEPPDMTKMSEDRYDVVNLS